MKKLVSMFLVLLIISTNVLAFASIDDKLINHWSKSIIEKDFVAYYFPYLAKDKFNKFNPEDNISKKDFTLSLASLFKDYGLDDITNNIGIYEPLTRKELVEIVGSKLISIDTIKYENQELPFQDINTMNKDSIELLRVLFNLKIINGVSSINFAPDRKVTQAEAIIILQRLKGVLEDM
ncbi:S-layer homology domain-containing protein, partial [Tissierella praeacuta]